MLERGERMTMTDEQREAFRKMDALAATGEDTPEYRAAFAEWSATHGMNPDGTPIRTVAAPIHSRPEGGAVADHYEYAWVNTETGEVAGLHRNPTSRWLRDKSWAPGPQWRRMRRIPASKWQDIEPAARSVSDPKEEPK